MQQVGASGTRDDGLALPADDDLPPPIDLPIDLPPTSAIAGEVPSTSGVSRATLYR
jgi:hypothetical protein